MFKRNSYSIRAVPFDLLEGRGYVADFPCHGTLAHMLRVFFESASTLIADNPDTIPMSTKILGYDSSTAKTYATKYYRTFEEIIVPVTGIRLGITLNFKRGKILNSTNTELGIDDAVAGLQYLAGLREAGFEEGQVNPINMASILPPDPSTGELKPSVKDVIALMQKLVGLRDDSFELVS